MSVIIGLALRAAAVALLLWGASLIRQGFMELRKGA